MACGVQPVPYILHRRLHIVIRRVKVGDQRAEDMHVKVVVTLGPDHLSSSIL
jgi:hypothetical protein